MSSFTIVALSLFSLASFANIPKKYPLVGIQQTELQYLQSKNYGEKFEIDIWLPKEYAKEKDKKYPVIFLTDSELNFPVVSFVVRRLIKNKDMPPAILVGISHNTTYEDWYYIKRARDLTPIKWSHKKFPQTGQASKFKDFLKEEVFPFIKANYRVDLNDKTLVGMSFGGLFAHYLMFNFPKIFQRYLIVSPSIWYGDKYLLKQERTFSLSNKELNAVVYTAVGAKEPDYFVKDWSNLNRQINKRKYQGLKFKADLLEEENHRSISPRAFTNGFRFIFGK